MSKQLPAVLPIALCLIIAAVFTQKARAQDIAAVISVRSTPAHSVKVSGSYSAAIPSEKRRNLAIMREYAGIGGFGERLSSLVLEDAAGGTVAFRQFVPGEWVAERDYKAWHYDLDLSPRQPSTVAHTSWLTGREGLFFLADILPIAVSRDKPVSARVRIDLPEGWSTASGSTIIEVPDIDRSVIYVGKQHHRQQIRLGGTVVNLVRSGQWLFTADELAAFFREIYSEYRQIFGADPAPEITLNLLHFPVTTPAGVWEADTRGSTVTIVSSDMPFRTQSLQRLHEQLRHELFHLWVPNALNLSGSYDWFYEGFALYQSLKTAVALNRIRFDDFLDTLSRAHTIDSGMTGRRSLLDASASRTAGKDTGVYARGMLVAFVTDLRMLAGSRGRDDITDLVRRVFQGHGLASVRTDGTSAVLEAIGRDDIRRLVASAGPLEWSEALAAVGMESTRQGSVTKLRIVADLTGPHRRLLDKLGYNNWRRTLSRPK